MLFSAFFSFDGGGGQVGQNIQLGTNAPTSHPPPCAATGSKPSNFPYSRGVRISSISFTFSFCGNACLKFHIWYFYFTVLFHLFEIDFEFILNTSVITTPNLWSTSNSSHPQCLVTNYGFLVVLITPTGWAMVLSFWGPNLLLLLCPFHKKMIICEKMFLVFCQTDNPQLSFIMYCYRRV